MVKHPGSAMVKSCYLELKGRERPCYWNLEEKQPDRSEDYRESKAATSQMEP